MDDMIGALEEEAKAGNNYRRFKWAWLLLQSIKNTYEEDRLKVITYGH